MVPGPKACQCFGFVPSPHAGTCRWRRCVAFHPWHAPRGRIAAIGAFGKHLAGIVRQSIGTGLAVVAVGGRDGDLLDQGRIGVGTDMGLEAMNRWSALMLDPMALFVILTGRGDDR